MRPVHVEAATEDDDADHEQRPDDFDDVFRASHDRLVRLAGLLCGDAALAEDAVAEAFARVYRRWQPGAIGDIDAYLRRAVVNEVAGAFRRRGRARRHRASFAVAPPTSTEEDVAEHDRLWQALLRLPRRQRAVLVLRYFDDASEARVAEILEMPAGTVKSTAARGLERLHRILGGSHDGD